MDRGDLDTSSSDSGFETNSNLSTSTPMRNHQPPATKKPDSKPGPLSRKTRTISNKLLEYHKESKTSNEDIGHENVATKVEADQDEYATCNLIGVKPGPLSRKTKRKHSTENNEHQGKFNCSKDEVITKKPKTEVEQDEDTFCLCNGARGDGDMIDCDNGSCSIEWFHIGCVLLTSMPGGRWYCPNCRGDNATIMRTKDASKMLTDPSQIQRPCPASKKPTFGNDTITTGLTSDTSENTFIQKEVNEIEETFGNVEESINSNELSLAEIIEQISDEDDEDEDGDTVDIATKETEEFEKWLTRNGLQKPCPASKNPSGTKPNKTKTDEKPLASSTNGTEPNHAFAKIVVKKEVVAHEENVITSEDKGITENCESLDALIRDEISLPISEEVKDKEDVTENATESFKALAPLPKPCLPPQEAMTSEDEATDDKNGNEHEHIATFKDIDIKVDVFDEEYIGPKKEDDITEKETNQDATNIDATLQMDTSEEKEEFDKDKDGNKVDGVPLPKEDNGGKDNSYHVKDTAPMSSSLSMKYIIVKSKQKFKSRQLSMKSMKNAKQNIIRTKTVLDTKAFNLNAWYNGSKYRCRICIKTFPDVVGIQLHIANKHKKNKSDKEYKGCIQTIVKSYHVCMICMAEVVKNRFSISRHVIMAHGMKFTEYEERFHLMELDEKPGKRFKWGMNDAQETCLINKEVVKTDITEVNIERMEVKTDIPETKTSTKRVKTDKNKAKTNSKEASTDSGEVKTDKLVAKKDMLEVKTDKMEGKPASSRNKCGLCREQFKDTNSTEHHFDTIHKLHKSSTLRSTLRDWISSPYIKVKVKSDKIEVKIDNPETKTNSKVVTTDTTEAKSNTNKISADELEVKTGKLEVTNDKLEVKTNKMEDKPDSRPWHEGTIYMCGLCQQQFKDTLSTGRHLCAIHKLEVSSKVEENIILVAKSFHTCRICQEEVMCNRHAIKYHLYYKHGEMTLKYYEVMFELGTGNAVNEKSDNTSASADSMELTEEDIDLLEKADAAENVEHEDNVAMVSSNDNLAGNAMDISYTTQVKTLGSAQDKGCQQEHSVVKIAQIVAGETFHPKQVQPMQQEVPPHPHPLQEHDYVQQHHPQYIQQQQQQKQQHIQQQQQQPQQTQQQQNIQQQQQQRVVVLKPVRQVRPTMLVLQSGQKLMIKQSLQMTNEQLRSRSVRFGPWLK